MRNDAAPLRGCPARLRRARRPSASAWGRPHGGYPAAARPGLPAIAQRQSIDALGRSKSFQEFEVSLQRALLDLGVLEGTGR